MTFRIPPDLRTKLGHSKIVVTVFHLNNQEAKREFAVYNNNNNNLLTFCTVPTYLRVQLDESLTFPDHTEALRKTLKSRVVLLRRLAWPE